MDYLIKEELKEMRNKIKELEEKVRELEGNYSKHRKDIIKSFINAKRKIANNCDRFDDYDFDAHGR